MEYNIKKKNKIGMINLIYQKKYLKKKNKNNIINIKCFIKKYKKIYKINKIKMNMKIILKNILVIIMIFKNIMMNIIYY